jgi:hypothetical protein
MATNKSDGDTRMTILYTRFVTQHELKILGKKFFGAKTYFEKKFSQKIYEF